MKLLYVLCFLFTYVFLNAQENSKNTKFWEGLCRNEDWGRAFWADMDATLTNIEISLAKNSPEYDLAKINKKYRPYIFSYLGTDLPIWAGYFSNEKYGLSIIAPFVIEVWLDLFESSTSPVINTSYRIGAPGVSFYHKLNKTKFGIKNYILQLYPMRHESTHIGDELTIMRKDAGLPLTRVNVSYNFAELALTINDAEGSSIQNNSFKTGFMLLHSFNKGWYSILPAEGDVRKVIASKSPYEYYFQYQYQSNSSKHNLQLIASIELRNRLKYNYPSYNLNGNNEWVETIKPESRNWAINSFCGVQYNNPKAKGYFSKIGVGIRFYHGVNPYGQFRSQTNFNQIGFSIIFD